MSLIIEFCCKLKYFLFRLVISTEEDPIMHLHLLQFTFMLLSPITYALDMPQRFWPGKFDIIGKK